MAVGLRAPVVGVTVRFELEQARKDGSMRGKRERMNTNFQKRQTKEDIRSVTGNRAVKRSVERCAVV